MVTNVKGVFRDFSGTIYLDEKDLTKSRAEGSIRVESIDTGIKKRDDHLRSPDFFDVGTFPEIRYQTTRIEPKGENRFVVYGKLTIRDVTKEIPLDVEYMGKVVGMDGKPRIGFHAEGKINRKDFKVLWDKRLDNGAIVVGDEVKISLDIEAVQE
jgi:polyisoprenoid-binding protein YceI